MRRVVRIYVFAVATGSLAACSGDEVVPGTENSAPAADTLAEEAMCCLSGVPSQLGQWGYGASDDSIAGCSNGIYWLYFSNYPPQCCNQTSDCEGSNNGWTCYFGSAGASDPPNPDPDPFSGHTAPVKLDPETIESVGKCCPPLLPEAQATNYPGCPTS
jgi:hypothetical protein